MLCYFRKYDNTGASYRMNISAVRGIADKIVTISDDEDFNLPVRLEPLSAEKPNCVSSSFAD